MVLSPQHSLCSGAPSWARVVLSLMEADLSSSAINFWMPLMCGIIPITERRRKMRVVWMGWRDPLSIEGPVTNPSSLQG